MSLINLEQELAAIAIGPRLPDDLFFEEGNVIIRNTLLKNYGVYHDDDEDLLHKQVRKFDCGVLGCQKSFDTVFLFDQHYNTCHRFTCSECKKIIATAHLLDLHISEEHDSFFSVLSERVPMYACFAEDCTEKFLTGSLRKDHCVSIHKFPSTWCDINNPSAKKSNTGAKHKSKKVKDTPSVSKGGSEEAMQIDSKPIMQAKNAKTKTCLGSGQFVHGRRKKMFSFDALAESLPKID